MDLYGAFSPGVEADAEKGCRARPRNRPSRTGSLQSSTAEESCGCPSDCRGVGMNLPSRACRGHCPAHLCFVAERPEVHSVTRGQTYHACLCFLSILNEDFRLHLRRPALRLCRWLQATRLVQHPGRHALQCVHQCCCSLYLMVVNLHERCLTQVNWMQMAAGNSLGRSVKLRRMEVTLAAWPNA